MASLDATFLIDLLDGRSDVLAKVDELDASEEPLEVTPPAAVEVLMGGYIAGGTYLNRTLELIRRLDLLDLDGRACEEAGRIAAELRSRGQALAWMDLLIGAITKRHGRRLVTKDPDFARIPGLVVESY